MCYLKLLKDFSNTLVSLVNYFFLNASDLANDFSNAYHLEILANDFSNTNILSA